METVLIQFSTFRSRIYIVAIFHPGCFPNGPDDPTHFIR